MELGDDDSFDTSLHEGSISKSVFSGTRFSHKRRNDFRPVSFLRPKKAVISSSSSSVMDVCRMMKNCRVAAALIADDSSDLIGILTDHDITRRVVARLLDPASTPVAKVMTKNPKVVCLDDSAMDALGLMIENHYRYLPVTDSNGEICGLLDIGKCLNDAISKLEKSESKKNSSVNQFQKIASAQGADDNQVAILSKLLGPIMSQAFDDQSSPTLRTLLAGKPGTATIVLPTSSVQVAGVVMAENHKAALVVENRQLVGIVSFKDIMTRAIAKGVNLETTEVTDVMTPEPESVTPETTVVEAMQIMHDNKFLTLPVCEDDGTICGVVDIMDLIYGAGGSDGWRSIFDSAMDVEDTSTLEHRSTSSVSTLEEKRKSNPTENFVAVKIDKKVEPIIHISPESPFVGAAVNNVPNQVIFKEGDFSEKDSLGGTFDGTFGVSPDRQALSKEMVVFKVIGNNNKTYRIRSLVNYETFLEVLISKVDRKLDPKTLKLHFYDDEGDEIVISSDDCLSEAVSFSRGKAIKLYATFPGVSSSSTFDGNSMVMIGSGAALAVAVAIVAMMKQRR